MNQLNISGAQFRDMLTVSAALLEKNKQTIDALNVFPVPDGDTGTNMCMTMQSAAREIHKMPDTATVSEVADALSMGALRGARGNSGVILSQLFRGFSRAAKGSVTMDAQLLAKALTMGSEAAYKAVMRPKEGTILTVARESAEKVAALADNGANFYHLVDALIEAGEKTLAKTPDLLPVLKEAGVVDSGGKGLVTIYRGFKLYLDGEEVADYEEEPMAAAVISEDSELTEESITYGYCTEFFIVRLNPTFKEAALDGFREHLMRMGDSVVAAYDSGMVKVHVHTDSPGKVLQMALRFGELDKLKIENMREQNRELQEERKRSEKEFAMIAVSAGEGLDALFTELTVDHVITGGQTMNPSIDSIASAIRKVNARNVFVLPNNSNIILAAQQAAELVPCKVIVLPTKTIPQGIAAAMAFNPDESLEGNTQMMTEAFQNVISGAVTYAVRKTRFNGKQIEKGDILGMIDNDLCVVDGGVAETTKTLLQQMLDKRAEQYPNIVLYYGADVKEEDAGALLSELQEKYPDAECMLQNGGQALYYYYISVE